MVAVITSGSVKPLTAVERAFAAACRGEITVNGEKWIDAHACVRLAGWTELQSVYKTAIDDGWRFVLHVPRAFGRNAGREFKYYARADVLETAQRVKRKRTR